MQEEPFHDRACVPTLLRLGLVILMTAIYRLSVYSLVLPLELYLHVEQAEALAGQTLASAGLPRTIF